VLSELWPFAKCGLTSPSSTEPSAGEESKKETKKSTLERRRSARPFLLLARHKIKMWPFSPRSSVTAKQRGAALGRCDAQRRAYAACIAANSGGGEASSSSTSTSSSTSSSAKLAERACASLATTLLECLSQKCAPEQAAAFAECVSTGKSKGREPNCGREVEAMRSALRKAKLFPFPPLQPPRRHERARASRSS